MRKKSQDRQRKTPFKRRGFFFALALDLVNRPLDLIDRFRPAISCFEVRLWDPSELQLCLTAWANVARTR